MIESDLIDTFQRLAMALGIGFLLGVERGWRHREAPAGSRAAGLRTHAVIGLLGGVCGALLPVIGPVGFAAMALASAAALIVFKLRESERDNDVSATGTLAALVVFALGAYCMHGDLRVAAAAGVTLVGLMAFKEALHDWLVRLTWSELRSALLILAASAIALPLLPNRAVDPWGAINPRELWLLTILVAGASFAGYVAVRVLGEEVGVLAGAAAGAFVSSTVVTAELGRRVRAGTTGVASAAAGACLAAAISMVRVCLFVAVAAVTTAPHTAPAALGAAAVFVLAAVLMRRGAERDAGANRGMQNPLDVRAVGQFALFLGAVIIVGRLIADAYGQAGLLPFAASAGIVDVDAAALAAASLVHGGLDPRAGAHAILLALLVNTFAKGGIAVVTGGWGYARAYLLASLVAAGFALAVWSLAGGALAPMFT